MRVATKKLCDVAQIVMGQSPEGVSYNTEGVGLPFFQGKTEFGKTSPIATKWCTRPKKLAQKDDILISVRAPVGPTNLASEECCIGRGLAAIRADNRVVDRDFLLLYLKHIESELVQMGQGSTFEAIGGQELSHLNVPIPPYDKQLRIAARLKARIAEVETARSGVEFQLLELGKLANSIIKDTIEQKNIPPVQLGDVLVEVKAGVGSSWSHYPVLGATREGLAPAKEPVGKKPERYKPVVSGTVFYNPMRILIGSIAFVDDDDEPGITSPDYVVLHGKENLVDSRWFYYWLRSPYGEQCISSLARGAVRERMLFNRLSEGTISLPPYSVQVRASGALKELKSMKYAIEKQLKDIMPSRLLSQAFEIDS
jgi:type I restriction enzyme S subunit